MSKAGEIVANLVAPGLGGALYSIGSTVKDLMNGTNLSDDFSGQGFSSIDESFLNSGLFNRQYYNAKQISQSDQAFNAMEAAKQRAWEEHMSNTAYQRAANDLEAAGFNRALVLGQPAATPTSTAAHSAHNVNSTDSMAILASLMSGLAGTAKAVAGIISAFK